MDFTVNMANQQSIDFYSSARPEQDTLEYCQFEFATILSNHTQIGGESTLSPQLARRMQLLIEFNHCQINGRTHELIRRISSVFNRLLLELIQAHYNTKQREQDLIRLVNSKGCTILEPKLTDSIMTILIKLFKAAGQYKDTSFERSVLVKFLLKDLGNQNYGKKQVERVIQTLYKSNCFHVITMENAPGRLKLKDEFCNSAALRKEHDSAMINLAQEENIRLSPESWAYLLHQSPHPDDVARMQSLLDKNQATARVAELRAIVHKMGDRHGISESINDLEQIQDLIDKALNNNEAQKENFEKEKTVATDLMRRMLSLRHLFSLRQRRGNR